MSNLIVNVAGLATVQIDTASGNTLESLGYTQDGVELEFEPKYINVPGDENAGLEDVPVEIEYIGEIAQIRMRFTKYDETVAAKIRCATYGSTEGTPAAVGSLMFNGGLTFRICINSPTLPYNFPRCVIYQPHSMNRGNKYTTWNLQATAYKNASGVLYNRVIT